MGSLSINLFRSGLRRDIIDYQSCPLVSAAEYQINELYTRDIHSERGNFNAKRVQNMHWQEFRLGMASHKVDFMLAR